MKKNEVKSFPILLKSHIFLLHILISIYASIKSYLIFINFSNLIKNITKLYIL